MWSPVSFQQTLEPLRLKRQLLYVSSQHKKTRTSIRSKIHEYICIILIIYLQFHPNKSLNRDHEESLCIMSQPINKSWAWCCYCFRVGLRDMQWFTQSHYFLCQNVTHDSHIGTKSVHVLHLCEQWFCK